MSNRESIIRKMQIIRKLRRKASTSQEILDYLKFEGELQGYNFDISQRTLHRDLDDIRAVYCIDIQFDFSQKLYYIDFDEHSEINERILEAFDIFNTMNLTDRLSEHVHFEKRKPQGTENFYGFLHAIKNHLQISFTYQSYWDEEPAVRLVEPYALKEFRNRWYILAQDTKDGIIKSFGLDRLSAFEITNTGFKPIDFNVNKHYKDCFGIISPNAEKPTEIVLSFNFRQGKFIKSLPLHESQEILIDNENELRIKLTIFITHDFIMELLSQGPNMKVLQPQSLVDTLKTSLQETLNQY